ncbi:GDP-mannose pyrophosphorylase [Gonapodya prolifera JEL478]|uniref:mannose-1-phosphate guanylyltransferase n=1 Tax=Gonapodya prolifera (strain JEL478) TaxID=1344416 RepID=A0A139A964_GONPJ|nr:GDP-mannose pyrophosphorylase [Gonapodya prolifera JEL478]|eukprot:KXS13371.1 GDP-mannose pyrophosphorylase [Gonapodya prolifera JEL478]
MYPSKFKALILVGGFGTRLRPLTLTKPKPLVEFANRPIVEHQIEALVKAGVTDIVLAVNYRPEVMAKAMHDYESRYNVKIHFSVETEPLGTAGPIALARDVLLADATPFFVLNSDVICEFPFSDLAAFHTAHGGEGTIMVTKVDDPTKYGVVVTKGGSSVIDRFVEKPQIFVGDRINAGIYIFNPSVIDRIQPRPTSIEREIFPAMASESQLHCMDLEGIWMDVGQPKDYLLGTSLYLQALADRDYALAQAAVTSSAASSATSPTPVPSPSPVASSPYRHSRTASQAKPPRLVKIAGPPLCRLPFVKGNVLIDPSASIGEGCKIGPDVIIGPGVVIGDGVRIVSSVIMEAATIKDHAFVKRSIVGWHSTVGQWARLDGTAVLGDDVHVVEEVYVNGAIILPHKEVKACVLSPQIIM